MRVGGRWVAMFCVIVIVPSGCSSTDEVTTTSVTGSTVHVVEPSSTAAPTTTSRAETSVAIATPLEVTTTDETTSSDDTTTTDETPTADLITRPYVDPAVCGSGAKLEFSRQDLTAYPFALGRDDGTAVQVFGRTTDGVANPFAVALRLPATARDMPQDHLVTVNGNDVGITVFANGNAAAAWRLPDGTKAYVRARDLDESALVALVARLTPRDADAPALTSGHPATQMHQR